MAVEQKTKPITAADLRDIAFRAGDLAAGRDGERIITWMVGEIWRLRAKVRYLTQRVRDLEAEHPSSSAPTASTAPPEDPAPPSPPKR